MARGKFEGAQSHGNVGTTGRVDRGRASTSVASQFHSRTTDVSGSIQLPAGARMVMAGHVIQ